MGTMSRLDRRGDTKIIWDADSAEETAAAKAVFDDLTSKGFLAWTVEGEKGKKKDQIRKFNPKAERIILAPPMRGG